MRKFVLFLMLVISSYIVSAQSPDRENQAIDSLYKHGRMNKDQAAQLKNKWNTFIGRFKYPVFNINARTGEFEVSDILTFPDADKKVIFQRCLQWIAINYGDLTYSDPESGKIIANGLIDLTHYADFPAGFGTRETREVQTSTSYTMILTIKDNKVKYLITNITYNFKNYSESIDEVSFPIISLFPIVTHDQAQWMRYVTVLTATIDHFSVKLKNSLTGYVNEAENDNKF